MSEPKDMLDQLSVAFPANAVEQREGSGGKMFSYVAAETVIRRLNAVAVSWDFRKTGHEFMPPVHYTDRNNKSKLSQTLIVFGELTIPGLGTRSGTGVQNIDPEGRAGEDMIKGAMSDCLKKCATQFGVALELYGPDLEAGEIPENTPQRARGTTRNVIPVEEQGMPAPTDPNAITPKQIGMIRKVAEEKGIPPEEVRAMHGKASAKDLTKQEASKLIERLIAMDSRIVNYDPRAEQDVLGLGEIAANANRFLA